MIDQYPGYGPLRWIAAFILAPLTITLLILFWFLLLFPGQATCADCAKAGQWYQQGLILSDNSAEEIACYKKAIELCPEYAPAHERLGNVYKARQQWDLALKELQLACENSLAVGLRPLASPHTSLGEIYRMLGQYELAIQEFQTALDINADDKRAQANLEYIYRMMGRDDHADEPRSLVPAPTFSREPGFTLPRGATLVDLQLQYVQLRREWGAPTERAVNVWKLISGIRYGLTGNLTVGVIPKVLWKMAYVRTPGGSEYQPSAYGLGDTVALLKYGLWSHKKTSLAANLKINIPTGNENKTVWSMGNAFSVPLGSGKYEFMPGLSFSANIRNLGYLHTNLQYFFTRKRANGLDPGDELQYNIAFCHSAPLLGAPYFLSMPVTDAVFQMELNGVYLGKSSGYRVEIEGGGSSQVYDTYPGGHTIFWSPGVQLLFYGNIKLELGVQVPLLVPEDPWIKKPVYQVGLTRFFF